VRSEWLQLAVHNELKRTPISALANPKFPAYTAQHWPRRSRGLRSEWSGRLAQLVEQMTLNHRVAGSNPASPTIPRKACALHFPNAVLH
jgi:hypothetical protein